MLVRNFKKVLLQNKVDLGAVHTKCVSKVWKELNVHIERFEHAYDAQNVSNHLSLEEV